MKRELVLASLLLCAVSVFAQAASFGVPVLVDSVAVSPVVVIEEAVSVPSVPVASVFSGSRLVSSVSYYQPDFTRISCGITEQYGDLTFVKRGRLTNEKCFMREMISNKDPRVFYDKTSFEFAKRGLDCKGVKGICMRKINGRIR